jgi:hypothetical protein
MNTLKYICAGLLITGMAAGILVSQRCTSAAPMSSGPSTRVQSGEHLNVPIKVGDPIIIKDKKPKK